MTEVACNPAKGWILAAPASNSGKTLVSSALLRLLRREDGSITPYKVGPDYIDPGSCRRRLGRFAAIWTLGPWRRRAWRSF